METQDWDVVVFHSLETQDWDVVVFNSLETQDWGRWITTVWRHKIGTWWFTTVGPGHLWSSGRWNEIQFSVVSDVCLTFKENHIILMPSYDVHYKIQIKIK